MGKELGCRGMILAAGGSARLGRSKQLVTHDGTPLIVRVINQLFDAGCDDVDVIIGADARNISEAVRGAASVESVHIIENPNWPRGQSTSLLAGLKHQAAHPSARVLVALCDQPWIPTSHYRNLIHAQRSANVRFTATDYDQGAGVPACFDENACRSLSLSLKSDTGAKHWMRKQAPDSFELHRCTQAELDVDEQADVDRLHSVQLP